MPLTEVDGPDETDEALEGSVVVAEMDVLGVDTDVGEVEVPRMTEVVVSAVAEVLAREVVERARDRS